MKVLIVGLGSIADRHINALLRIDSESQVLALRSTADGKKYDNIINIYSWNEVPRDIDFIIISNPTFAHYDTLNSALDFEVPIFLEKPPFMNLTGVSEIIQRIRDKNITVYTAFNLRFYPLIQWLKNNLNVNRVLEVQAYCGSYLPNWRKDQDYRSNYSAIRAMGGGVHLDLTHEMDYLVWIFGFPISSIVSLSTISKLELDTVDSAHYWLEYKNMNISILLNYFRRDSKRTIEIVMEDDTWNVNLLNGSIVNSTGSIIYNTSYNIVETYFDQMNYFIKCIKSGKPVMNDIHYSVQTLNLCLNEIR